MSEAMPVMKKRRGGVMMAVGGVLMVVGLIVVVIAAVVGVWSIGSFGSGMQGLTIPGSAMVTLPEAGTYYIYHERGGPNDAPLPVGAGVTITMADGTRLPAQQTSMDMTYAYGGREGRAVWLFEAPRPGSATITATAMPGAPKADLTVGRGVMGMIGGIFGMVCGLIGGGLLGLAGLVFLIIGIVRRKRPA